MELVAFFTQLVFLFAHKPILKGIKREVIYCFKRGAKVIYNYVSPP